MNNWCCPRRSHVVHAEGHERQADRPHAWRHLQDRLLLCHRIREAIPYRDRALASARGISSKRTKPRRSGFKAPTAPVTIFFRKIRCHAGPGLMACARSFHIRTWPSSRGSAPCLPDADRLAKVEGDEPISTAPTPAASSGPTAGPGCSRSMARRSVTAATGRRTSIRSLAAFAERFKAYLSQTHLPDPHRRPLQHGLSP